MRRPLPHVPLPAQTTRRRAKLEDTGRRDDAHPKRKQPTRPKGRLTIGREKGTQQLNETTQTEGKKKPKEGMKTTRAFPKTGTREYAGKTNEKGSGILFGGRR